jgi:DNA-binding NarL/FixJ family response regulator
VAALGELAPSVPSIVVDLAPSETMISRLLSGQEEGAELMVRLALQTGHPLIQIYEQIRISIAKASKSSQRRSLLEAELDESLVRLVARLRSPVNVRPTWQACVLTTEGRGVSACISHLMLEAGVSAIVLAGSSDEHSATSRNATIAHLLPTIDYIVIDGSRAAPEVVGRCLRFVERLDYRSTHTEVILLTDLNHPIDPADRLAIPELVVVGHLATLMTALGITSGNPLTGREREVLRQVAIGATNEQAARRMGVAVSTIKTYLERIHTKLKSCDRASAVATAMLRDWL